jgi:hypothetical protein
VVVKGQRGVMGIRTVEGGCQMCNNQWMLEGAITVGEGQSKVVMLRGTRDACSRKTYFAAQRMRNMMSSATFFNAE